MPDYSGINSDVSKHTKLTREENCDDQYDTTSMHNTAAAAAAS